MIKFEAEKREKMWKLLKGKNCLLLVKCYPNRNPQSAEASPKLYPPTCCVVCLQQHHTERALKIHSTTLIFPINRTVPSLPLQILIFFPFQKEASSSLAIKFLSLYTHAASAVRENTRKYGIEKKGAKTKKNHKLFLMPPSRLCVILNFLQQLRDSFVHIDSILKLFSSFFFLNSDGKFFSNIFKKIL